MARKTPEELAAEIASAERKFWDVYRRDIAKHLAGQMVVSWETFKETLPDKQTLAEAAVVIANELIDELRKPR